MLDETETISLMNRKSIALPCVARGGVALEVGTVRKPDPPHFDTCRRNRSRTSLDETVASPSKAIPTDFAHL